MVDGQGCGCTTGTLSMAVSSSPRPTASLMMAPDSSISSVTLVCRRRNVRVEGVAVWVWKVKAGGEEAVWSGWEYLCTAN